MAHPAIAQADDASAADAGKTDAIWCLTGKKKLEMWQAALIVAVCAIPNIAVVAVLSDVGIGLQLYSALSSRTMSLGGDLAIFLATLSMVALYVVDWLYWQSVCRRTVAAMVPVALITAGAFLKSRKYPWAPLLFTLFLIPFALGTLRAYILKETMRREFYRCVSLGTSVAAMGVFVGWMAWMGAGGHFWNRDTKDDLAARSSDIYKSVLSSMELDYVSHCHPTLRDLSAYDPDQVKDIIGACSTASNIWFLVWCAPLVAVVCDVVAAVFCYQFGVRSDHGQTSLIARALRQFMLCLIFLLVVMYGTVSFTSLTLNSTIMAFFAAALTTLVVWSFIEIGPRALQDMATASPFAKHLATAWRSDWIRAIAVGAANVFIPIYFFLNMSNQRYRKLRNPNASGRYTPQAQKLLEDLKEWNWVSILTKVALLAELFFTLQVGVSKVTYIFLSWLSRELAAVNFVFVCLLAFAIGFMMFMLPPVPGVPVYVFTGIVIADQGDRKLGENGFIWGILIAICLAFANKLAACCGQYSIGYFAGKNIKVQQLIKVDSVPTRAIESIVKRPGLNPAKVAILIGGPDWPTSVGCGMVKVSVPQMLLGTLPVVFLLSPCVLAGAFIARQGAGGEDSMFPMLTNLSLIAATVTQAASGVAAGAFVMREIQVNGEELAKERPEHAAVAELTRKEQHSKDVFKEVTKWTNLSSLDAAILISMTAALEFSCMLFALAGEACFRPFSVDKDINAPWEQGGLNGDPLSIVLHPVGSGALAIFFFGVVLHIAHSKMMSCKHRSALAAEATKACA